jgi:multicomponent Na+:H+ antiporter subunit E
LAAVITDLSTATPFQWLTRLALFALVWLVLAGTDPLSWVIGVPAVLFATVTAARLSQLVGSDPRPLPLLGFVPFFVWESILGGVDVARRVLGPKLLIDPALVTYRPRLQDPAARVVFLDTISLLPGTLAADFRDGIAYVHALEASAAVVAGLDRLEHRVAGLFGQRLDGAPEVTVQPCGTDALAMARAAMGNNNGGERG